MTVDRDALYDRFRAAQARGLKAEAKTAVRAFLDSFTTFEEREAWTDAHLPDLVTNRHASLRHEIYAEVIFPVLLARYTSGDAESHYWLAQTMQSVLSARALFDQLGDKTPVELLKVAHAAEPARADFAEALLRHLLDEFHYLDHEWPAGILLPMDATGAMYDAVLQDVALARRLDAKGTYKDRLREFESRVIADHPERRAGRDRVLPRRGQ